MTVTELIKKLQKLPEEWANLNVYVGRNSNYVKIGDYNFTTDFYVEYSTHDHDENGEAIYLKSPLDDC